MRLQSSLKWLIDRRARLLGEIERIEKKPTYSQAKIIKAITRVEARIAVLKSHLGQLKKQQVEANSHLKALKSDLDAIDRALRQHEVKVTPELIKPIRPHQTKGDLSYGEITRNIYMCLKTAYPEPRTAMDVAVFIAASSATKLSASELRELRFRVKQRLTHLTWEKKISRLHEAQTQEEGRWTLLPSSPLP